MKEVLSVFTFSIGALCFVVFVNVFKPTSVNAVHGTSKPAARTNGRGAQARETISQIGIFRTSLLEPTSASRQERPFP